VIVGEFMLESGTHYQPPMNPAQGSRNQRESKRNTKDGHR